MGQKIRLKGPEDIAKLQEGGKILSDILSVLYAELKPGVKGEELEDKAEKIAGSKGAKCSFHKFENFPSRICLSLNNEIVHGTPKDKVIKPGDIVSVDMGIEYEGLFTDSAFSRVIPPNDDPRKEDIVNTTFLCLKRSLNFCRKEYCLGDIGYAVQSLAESRGFSVVRKLVGHGVGYAVHEPPLIPNVGERGRGMKLRPGMVVAIEPMLCGGGYKVKLDKDKWTFKTSDGSYSAHFEWTVAVTKDKPVIITPLPFIPKNTR